jgi:hypothetical protein
MAAAKTACTHSHFVAAVGVDSDEDCRLASTDRSHYNARTCPDHPPVGDVHMAARVASDLQHVLLHIAVVFLNVSACVGKEVNAKVTETDALSMRVGLKDADRDCYNAAGTDRSK